MRNAVEKISLADIWEKYDLHHSELDAEKFIEVRDAITNRIEQSNFYANNEDCGLIVLRLEAAENTDEFDDLWNEFYDLCDLCKIHISLSNPHLTTPVKGE